LLVAFQDHHFFQQIIDNEVIESDQCGKDEKRKGENGDHRSDILFPEVKLALRSAVREEGEAAKVDNEEKEKKNED
jgi:hypothetical protein